MTGQENSTPEGLPHHEDKSQYGPIDEHKTHVVNYSYENYLTIVCVQAPPKATSGGGDVEHHESENHGHDFHNLLVTRYMIHWISPTFVPPGMEFTQDALFFSIYDALLAANIALVHGGFFGEQDLGHIEYGDHHVETPARHKVVLPRFYLCPRDTNGLTREQLLDTSHHATIKKRTKIYEIYSVQVPFGDEDHGDHEMFMIKWVDDNYCEKRFRSLSQGALLWSEEEAQRLALLTMDKEKWYDLVPHADLISYACEAYFVAMVAKSEYVVVWSKKDYCKDAEMIDKVSFRTDFDANEAAELALTDHGWYVLPVNRHDDHYLKYGYPYGLNHDDFVHLFGHEHEGEAGGHTGDGGNSHHDWPPHSTEGQTSSSSPHDDHAGVSHLHDHGRFHEGTHDTQPSHHEDHDDHPAVSKPVDDNHGTGGGPPKPVDATVKHPK